MLPRWCVHLPCVHYRAPPSLLPTHAPDTSWMPYVWHNFSQADGANPNAPVGKGKMSAMARSANTIILPTSFRLFQPPPRFPIPLPCAQPQNRLKGTSDDCAAIWRRPCRCQPAICVPFGKMGWRIAVRCAHSLSSLPLCVTLWSSALALARLCSFARPWCYVNLTCFMAVRV